MRTIATLLCTAALLAPAAANAADAPAVTHGAVVGDVSDSSALFWARAGASAPLHLRISGGPHDQPDAVMADPARDNTARVHITGLAPGTDYSYRASFGHGPAVTGSFRTAPSPRHAAPFRLDFGGDVAGQNVCKDSVDGFPILDTVRDRRPDVFMGLGDMIYADNAC